jgi:hypothetical protein
MAAADRLGLFHGCSGGVDDPADEIGLHDHPLVGHPCRHHRHDQRRGAHVAFADPALRQCSRVVDQVGGGEH